MLLLGLGAVDLHPGQLVAGHVVHGRFAVLQDFLVVFLGLVQVVVVEVVVADDVERLQEQCALGIIIYQLLVGAEHLLMHAQLVVFVALEEQHSVVITILREAVHQVFVYGDGLVLQQLGLRRGQGLLGSLHLHLEVVHQT